MTPSLLTLTLTLTLTVSIGLDRPPSTPVALHLGVKPASSPTSFTLDLPSSASDSKAHSGSKHSPHPEGGAPSEPRPVLQNAPQLMDDPPWLKAFAATTPGLTSDQGLITTLTLTQMTLASTRASPDPDHNLDHNHRLILTVAGGRQRSTSMRWPSRRSNTRSVAQPSHA